MLISPAEGSMEITWTRKYKVFKRELGLLITGFALFLVLNGCGSAGVAPGSSTGGGTTTSTADTTLVVPVDSSVSASVSKSLVKTVVKSVPKSVSKSSSPSFSVGKGVSASAASSSNDSSKDGESVEEEVVVVVAKAASDGSANECDAYDGVTGNQVNTEKGKIEGGQVKLPIDSSKFSSATAIIKLVCKVNGASMPILLPNDMTQNLLNSIGKGTSVESKIPLGATAIQAFYQMAVGMGNVAAMSDNKLPANILALNPQMFFNDVVRINADTSQTLSTAYQSTQKAILGFMGSGGVGGFTDCGKFFQEVSGGNMALFAQASKESLSQATTKFELEKKSAQFTGPMFADPKIAAQYQADPAYVTQMNSFRYTNFASEASASKMAVAMMQAPAVTMTMFQDFSNFKTMNMTAAGQVLTQAIDNNIISSGSSNAAQFEALRASAYQTNFSGKTVEQIQSTMSATTNYIRTNEISSASAETLTAMRTVTEFFATAAVAGTLDATKLDSAFMTAMQTNVQSQVVAQVQTQTQTVTQNYTQATGYITSFTSTFTMTSFIGGGTPAISDRSPYVGASTLLSINALSGSSPTAPMYIKFSMAMDATTLNPTNVTLTCNGTSVNRTIFYDSNLYKMTIRPMTVNGGSVPALLPKNQTCIVGLGAGVKSSAGVAIAANTLSFTTERDTFAISTWSIVNGATNVPTNTQICFTTNYGIDSAKVSNITLSCGGSNMAGVTTLTNGGLNACFDPNANIDPSANCTMTVGANLGSIHAADHILGTAVTRSFTAGLGSDVTNPDISSAVATLSSTSTSVTTVVAGATDDGTAANQLVCDVYHAAASGGQNFGSASATSNAGCGSAVVSGLSANTNYCFVARVKDATGNYSQMAEVCKKTAPSLPSTAWTSWDAFNSRVSIGSLKATGGVSFNVYRGLSCDSVSYIGNVVAPNADAWNTYYDNISNPKPYGTIYCYKWTSVGDSGSESERSSGSNVTISLVAPSLTLTTISSSQIDVSWNAVTDAASYKLYRSVNFSNCSDNVLLSSGAGISYSDTGRSADTNHYYCVKGVTSGSVDGSLGTSSKWTNPVTPSLSCSGASSSSVACSWTLPGSYYYLELKRSTGGAACDVNSSNIYTRGNWQSYPTGYTDSGLTAGTQYNYCLRWQTYSAYQWSALSSTQSVTPAVGAVGGVVAKAMGPRRVLITWNALEGATSYKVYRKTSAGVNPGTDALVIDTTGTMANDAGLGSGGLTAGTTYYYAVMPFTNGVEGTLSSEVSAAPAVIARAEGGGHPSYQTHTVFLKSNGTVWATGSNNNGQLGDGTTTNRTSPVQVVKGASTSGDSYIQGIIDIDAIGDGSGSATTIALKSDGTVWTWGDNDGSCCSNSGLLGDGAVATNRSSPDTIANLTGVIDVAAGNEYMLILKNDGTVWAWGGKNTYVALGDNTTNASTSLVQVRGPANVGNLANIVAIEAGSTLSYALTKDGDVYHWGGFTSQNVLTPTLIGNAAKPPSSKIISMAAGYRTLLALTTNKDIWGFGYNSVGQFGDNSTTTRTTTYSLNSAVKGTSCTGTLTDINAIAITPGSQNNLTAFAVKSDGTVYSWGESDSGALGDGAVVDRKCSASVPNLSSIVSVGAGNTSGFVIDSSGNFKAWGYNANSQLGDGSTTNRSTPVSVNNLP